jgi:phosphate transport system substrate-binding protein
MKLLRNLMTIIFTATLLAGCAGNNPAPAASVPEQPTTASAQPTNPPAATTGTQPAAMATVPSAVIGKGDQKIAISGAFALYPMVVQWADEYQKLHNNVRIDVSGGGAGKGMSDVLAGAVDIGMVSRDVTQEEKDKGAVDIAVARDAVFGTISAQNPYLADLQKMGITKETLAGIFLTGEITTWGQVIGKPEVTDEIHVYTRSDSAGAAEMWAKYMGGKKQDDIKGIGVNGDPGELEAVMKDPLGIGYNNLGYAFDLKANAPVAGAAVLALDVNENKQVDPDEKLDTTEAAVKAVADGKYPSPPARIEYLVTKGKPSGAVADFISWILTDGQQYIASAGYVQLTPDLLTEAQGKIK